MLVLPLIMLFIALCLHIIIVANDNKPIVNVNDEQKFENAEPFLDLTEVNISKEDLVTLSAEFNNLLTITIAENEPELLPRLQSVYSLIPKYLNQFSDNKSDIKDKELKSIVLSSYAFANNNDWEQAKDTIQTGIEKYNEMMNEARALATKRMVAEAEELGADAVINIRYASSAVMQGAAEVIVYGTAVKFINK